ncbi:hypothetical protein PL373_04835 [Tenacibaculum maritimum]|nr:hypothetical protein [Tenacibaculum maritimum]MDB0600481.1 hypothetical protein [Tenacibaculum maritimum]MDB0610635.1 hypothetical protein [Tenacibaculum maritimum]
MVTLSLFHVFFENKSKDVTKQYKLYSKVVKERDVFFENHFAKTGDEKGKKAYFDYKNKLYLIKTKKIKSAREHSFRGRSSFHFWLFLFGLITPIFYFSCKSLFDEFSRGSNFKHQLISLSGIVISFFWFIHLLFFTQKDFTKNSYIGLILLCSIASSVFTYFLIKKFTYKDQIINGLTNLLIRTKEDHYERVAVKAFYAEKNDKPIISLDTTKENIKEFQEDIDNTINNM